MLRPTAALRDDRAMPNKPENPPIPSASECKSAAAVLERAIAAMGRQDATAGDVRAWLLQHAESEAEPEDK